MTKAKTRKPSKTLVIDAGNGNVKVNLAGESELIPSLLSNNDGAYIRGGFALGDESWILGWDNYNRPDKKAVADSGTGKIDYLHLMLAGSLSAMVHLINPGDKLDIHLLTLNSDKRTQLEQAIQQATDNLSIDGEPFCLDAKLAKVYPEGVGASVYASLVFPCVPRVSVLDMGNGTLNLSQYFVGNPSKPRRESFSFVAAGVRKLVELTSDLLTSETTNGSVDENLVRQALDTNSYRYLDDYFGKDIWATAAKATEAWLELPKVKLLLTQAMKSLSEGVPLVCVGGGFSLHVVQQLVVDALDKRGQRDLIHIARDLLTVGVDGLAEALGG